MSENSPKLTYFESLESAGVQDASLASDRLLNITNELMGASDPKTALTVAYNLLHPEAVVEKEFPDEKKGINWGDHVTEERIEDAAGVLGQLLIGKSYLYRHGAQTDRNVLGLPSFDDTGKAEHRSVEPGDVSERTGLPKSRIIHRRYEALDNLARIWEGETGPTTGERFPKTKQELTSKIFDTYGQVGYGIIEALHKGARPLNQPFLYLDRTLQADKLDNPLHSVYSNGIAGYNKHAKAGRNALVELLVNIPFSGDQKLLDEETNERLVSIAGLNEEIESAMDTMLGSSRKTPEWAFEIGETISTGKTAGFNQVEAFKIAEILHAVRNFDPTEFPGPRQKNKAKKSASIPDEASVKPVLPIVERPAVTVEKVEGPFDPSSFDEEIDSTLLSRFSGTPRTIRRKAADTLNSYYADYKRGDFNAIPADVVEEFDDYFGDD